MPEIRVTVKLLDQAEPIATIELGGIPLVGQKIQIRRRGTPAIYLIVDVLHVVDDIKDEPIAQTTKALMSGERAGATTKSTLEGFADRPTMPIVMKPEGHTIELSVKPYQGLDG